MNLPAKVAGPARRVGLEVRGFRALVRAGMLGRSSPRTTRAIFGALKNYGAFGSASRIAALRHGDLPAIADDRGELTFADLDDRVNRLCNALRARGLGPGASVGVLCRNHRQLLIVGFAVARAGLNVVMLNTAFSSRQCGEVANREGVDLLVYDIELAEAVADVEAPLGKLACAIENASADELDALIAGSDPALPPAPESTGRIVMLTSGTTGTPKGAPREDPRGFIGAGAVLERMPMRAREATVVAPPLFHGTGLLDRAADDRPGVKARAAPPLRRRAVPRRHRRAQRDRRLRRAGHAAARARARRRRDPRARPLVAARGLLRGRAAARRGRDQDAGGARRRRSTTSTARPRWRSRR